MKKPGRPKSEETKVLSFRVLSKYADTIEKAIRKLISRYYK